MAEIKMPDAGSSGRSVADRKPREERWAEILRVAAEVFHAKGYHAASLQDIADGVGILKGSVYYYIKTKHDLLESLLIEVHNEGLAMTRAFAAADGGVLDRLSAMMRGHIDYMARNQAKAVVYLHELGRLKSEQRDVMFDRHAFRDVYQALIEQGQHEGLILADLDPKLTAQTMLGCLNSIYHWFRPNYDKPGTEIAAHFVRTQLRGIASESGIRMLDEMRI